MLPAPDSLGERCLSHAAVAVQVNAALVTQQQSNLILLPTSTDKWVMPTAVQIGLLPGFALDKRSAGVLRERDRCLMDRTILGEEAKLGCFTDAYRAEGLRVEEGAEGVISQHRGPREGEGVSDATAREQAWVEPFGKSPCGDIKDGVVSIDDHHVRHPGIQERLCHALRVTGA